MTDDIVARLRSPEVFLMTSGMVSPVAEKAADEIERLRAALGEITSASNELRNAAPSDYARGFNDGRWRMQQIARAALAGEKVND